MASCDWTSEESGGYDLLYEATCSQTTKTGRQWYALATARLQKKFVNDQSSEVRIINFDNFIRYSYFDGGF